MEDEQPSAYRAGDKVRVRSGPYAGHRGIVEGERADLIDVELETGEVIEVQRRMLTNFSLAARRAWAVMPKRAGRPRSSESRKKMVSIRVEIDLWERLERITAAGLISSREEAINTWIREHLERLEKDL
jgi:hypothetical protein